MNVTFVSKTFGFVTSFDTPKRIETECVENSNKPEKFYFNSLLFYYFCSACFSNKKYNIVIILRGVSFLEQISECIYQCLRWEEQKLRFFKPKSCFALEVQKLYLYLQYDLTLQNYI